MLFFFICIVSTLDKTILFANFIYQHKKLNIINTAAVLSNKQKKSAPVRL